MDEAFYFSMGALAGGAVMTLLFTVYLRAQPDPHTIHHYVAYPEAEDTELSAPVSLQGSDVEAERRGQLRVL